MSDCASSLPQPGVFPKLPTQPARVPFQRADPLWRVAELSSKMILPEKLATLRSLAELLYGEQGHGGERQT
jgi:hypothetical protein